LACRGRRTTTTAATPLDDGEYAGVASDQPGAETCEVARLKCAYRVGCGMALQLEEEEEEEGNDENGAGAAGAAGAAGRRRYDGRGVAT